jgi:hypothetical protein
MKKTSSFVAILGFVCFGLLTGCQKQETAKMPDAVVTNAPAVPAAPDTNAPAAPAPAAPGTNAPAAPAPAQ